MLSLGQIFQKLLAYLKSALSSFLYCIILLEKKLPKFGTKNALIVYFWIFKKLLWHSKFSTVKFDYLQFFAKKQKCPNLGPKMPYLSIFRLDFKKTIVIFEISALKLVSLQYFKKLLSQLKSAPSNLWNCEISSKNKIAKICDHKWLLWVFLG